MLNTLLISDSSALLFGIAGNEMDIDANESDDNEEMLLAIDTAAAEGDHATLEVLYSIARPLFTDKLCSKLAWAGHLNTLKFVRSLSPPVPLSALAMTLAVEQVQRSTIIWLLSEGCPVEDNVCDACAEQFDWPTFKLLIRRVPALLNPERAMLWLRFASELGRPDILAWLLIEQADAMQHVTSDAWHDAAVAAAWRGDRPILEGLLLSNNVQKLDRRLQSEPLAAAGHWGTVLWLARRLPADGRQALVMTCMTEAARQGKLDMLQLLSQLPGSPHLTPSVTAAAAECADLAILQYLRSLDAPWDWHCYKAAIMSQNVVTLEWLQKHGCPVNLDLLRQDISLPAVDHKVLPWMAAHTLCQDELEACSNGRLIYLAAAGWCMPDESMQRKLDHARACFCAFYGAASWLAKQQPSQATLGSLANELLQKIACEAHIDFSDVFDDLCINLEVQAKVGDRTRHHIKLVELLEEDSIADDDTTDGSYNDDQVQQVADELEGLALMEHQHRWTNIAQLQEEGQAGCQWLAQYCSGSACSHCSDPDCETDCDWLPDA